VQPSARRLGDRVRSEGASRCGPPRRKAVCELVDRAGACPRRNLGDSRGAASGSYVDELEEIRPRTDPENGATQRARLAPRRRNIRRDRAIPRRIGTARSPASCVDRHGRGLRIVQCTRSTPTPVGGVLVDQVGAAPTSQMRRRQRSALEGDPRRLVVGVAMTSRPRDLPLKVLAGSERTPPTCSAASFSADMLRIELVTTRGHARPALEHEGYTRTARRDSLNSPRPWAGRIEPRTGLLAGASRGFLALARHRCSVSIDGATRARRFLGW